MVVPYSQVASPGDYAPIPVGEYILDQDAACQDGATVGATCTAVGCGTYFFHCMGITLYQVNCGEAT